MEPARPTHPGRILKREITARGWTQIEAAAKLGTSEPHLSDIVRGHRNISAPMAIRLGNLLGQRAEFWWELQCTYELRVAQLVAREGTDG